MRPLRPLMWLALVLLSTLPAVAAAQVDTPAALTVEPSPTELLVALTCPEQAPALTVTLDHAPVQLLDAEAPAVAPPALVLVLDLSAPMGAAGTPHGTRLRDALGRAEALLALAPPGTTVALVSFDQTARLGLPLTADLAAARAALDKLAPVPPASGGEPPPYALAEAVTLGLAQLRAAPPGPRALVAFAAGTPALVPLAAPPVAPVGLLLVGQGADLPTAEAPEPGPLAHVAERLGADYVAYHSAEITALPTLNRALEAHFTRLLAPWTRLHLRLPSANLAPGAHLLAVEGCGAPLVTAFAQPRGLSAGALGLGAALTLVAGAAGVGVTARRSRRSVPVATVAPTDTPTARLRAAAAITTARRAATPPVGLRLRAVVWEGKRRKQLALEGRHWTIGRDPGCAICVEGEGIAPLHARVSLAGGKLELAYLGGAGSPGASGGSPAPLELGEVALLSPTLRLMFELEDAPTEGR